MLFYIWNEILLGELIFQFWVSFEEMNSNDTGREEKYVGMLRVQRGRVNSKRLRYSSCFSQLKNVEKHAVEKPKISILLDGDYKVLCSRISIQADTIHSYTQCLYSYIHPSWESGSEGWWREAEIILTGCVGEDTWGEVGRKYRQSGDPPSKDSEYKSPPYWLGKTQAL